MKILRLILPLLLLHAPLLAQDEKPADVKVIPHDQANLSLRNEVQHAIDKGLEYLASKQQAGGYWDMNKHPALTGLVLTAFQRDPSHHYKDSEMVKKGYAFILKNVHDDGGIYNDDELLNYNTSVCVMALLADDPAKYENILRKARKFLIGQQMEGDPKDKPYAGGIGYGDDEPNSDMSNMVFALEALHATNYLQETTAENSPTQKDLNWDAAIDFIQRCQNLSSVNKAKWVSDKAKDKGGFVYTPTEDAPDNMIPKAKTYTSYGSMSYAGLLSYIYAGVKKDDPRVQGAVDWIKNNYTVDENPGGGHASLYYYYHTFAKTLATYGQDKFTLANGKEVDWRSDLAKRLIDLQHEDGRWVNDNGMHWEKDSILVTAYSVLALEYVYQAQ
ncbi:MAG TPA: prenyltransferase/squalene oxidase repeat-containing protein [Chthoniobacteraceae bacterium]|nr:prenyltransferase/squalene oxidase repeat-containing protein [Chthoniobacteraceae bacterium]